MEITNASIEDIDRIEEIATAAFKSTVYYAKPILTTHVEHFPGWNSGRYTEYSY